MQNCCSGIPMSKDARQAKGIRQWKVLLVDSDRVCLLNLQNMLLVCNYQVTTCQRIEEAVSLLQEQNKFDIVIAEVYMPEIDGLEFVKYICEHTSLPVVAMSTRDDEETINKGFRSGACDYLVKPVQVENVRNVWMNVYRAQHIGSIKTRAEQSWSSSVATTTTTTKANESNTCDYEKKMRRKLRDDEQVDDNDATTRKKKRVIWTPELHHKFVIAVNQFQDSKAVPKKILAAMNVPDLARENVASHLQKYRQHYKRLEQHSCHQQNRNTQMISFHQSTQPHQNNAMSLQCMANKPRVIGENSTAIDHWNFGCMDHLVGGSSAAYYHPLASHTYPSSNMDSKAHYSETPSENDVLLGLAYDDGSCYLQHLDDADTYACL